MSPTKYETPHNPYNMRSGQAVYEQSKPKYSYTNNIIPYIPTRCLTYTIYLKALPETAFYNIQNRRTKLFFRFHYTHVYEYMLVYIYIYILYT